jgi:hypothetical protein
MAVRKTVFIFLCNLKLFVFVTEMECVYCAVGTEFLNIIPVNFILVKTVLWFWLSFVGLSLRGPWFDPTPIHVRFVVKVALGQVFSPSTSIYPCQYHSTYSLYSSISTCCSYQKDKRAKPGNLPKSNVLSEIGENCIEK